MTSLNATQKTTSFIPNHNFFNTTKIPTSIIKCLFNLKSLSTPKTFSKTTKWLPKTTKYSILMVIDSNFIHKTILLLFKTPWIHLRVRSLYYSLASNRHLNRNFIRENTTNTKDKPISHTSTKHNHIPNYNLKRTIFVYFYHRQKLGHYAEKYPLTTYELKILKKFLIKKLIQDKRKFKVLNIHSLNHQTYIQFLLENPPIYRKNIIKSKLFKKVIKQMKIVFPNLEVKYLSHCNERNKSIFENLNSKKAYNSMTNEFYQSCFENTVFSADFSAFLNNKTIISNVVRESKKKFTTKIDNWISIFAENLNDFDLIEGIGAALKVRLNSSRDEINEARRCFLEYICLVGSAGF